MVRSIEVRESVVVPVDAVAAWEAVTGGDLAEVSQPWGPIPGVVAVVDEPPRFFDEPGHSRVLANSDGSTMVETIRALEHPRTIDYTITDLTNSFRFLTPGARARFEFGPSGDASTRITWRYSWAARHVALVPVVWLVVHLAFRPYMRRMLGRIGRRASQDRSAPGP